ncbi:Uncharacterised protein [Candidatus Norongarragalina meridionalis]|nr:Uncharacterised protein [Candidatus Norongarragalina meridionalis]
MVDFFSHALWAFALFHNQPNAWMYAAFAVLPDFLFSLPAIFVFTTKGISPRHMRWRGAGASVPPEFGAVITAYHLSHSWLIMGLASWVVALLFPALTAPFFCGVFLHLAMDLFVHKDSVAGQMPLYPLSKRRVAGFFHWSNRKFMILNFALLALAYAGILLRIW